MITLQKNRNKICVLIRAFTLKKDGFIILIKMEALPQRLHEKTERTKIRLLNAAMRRT